MRFVIKDYEAVLSREISACEICKFLDPM